ncbi:MAG TPA: patatin-like phospholipase family protein [Epsilonproteobacteria bacterium]|nr:patatin-like phospholipase family protein [Campylobacterota bacterium]
MAHLGVLHDLEERDLTPSEIVGTSMGGIIGACLAIGMKEEEIYGQVKKFSKVRTWIKFSWGGNALVENDKLEKIFHSIFGELKISETLIPLKLIATNLLTGEKKVFDAEDDVSIVDALLCTIAIPGIFEEHLVDDSIYVDGFLCENLGLNETSLDHLIAVDVLGQHSFGDTMPSNRLKTRNMMEMFEKSMRLLIYNQTQSSLRHTNKSVLLIEPDTKTFSTHQFHKVDEIRQTGIGLFYHRTK